MDRVGIEASCNNAGTTRRRCDILYTCYVRI
jgi:hypothetical protein